MRGPCSESRVANPVLYRGSAFKFAFAPAARAAMQGRQFLALLGRWSRCVVSRGERLASHFRIGCGVPLRYDTRSIRLAFDRVELPEPIGYRLTVRMRFSGLPTQATLGPIIPWGAQVISSPWLTGRQYWRHGPRVLAGSRAFSRFKAHGPSLAGGTRAGRVSGPTGRQSPQAAGHLARAARACRDGWHSALR
jgi:hypothetical protein